MEAKIDSEFESDNKIKYENLQDGRAYIYLQDGNKKQHVVLVPTAPVTYLVPSCSEGSNVVAFSIRLIGWLEKLDNQEHFHLVKARYEKKIEYLRALQQKNKVKEIAIGNDFITFIEFEEINECDGTYEWSTMTMTFPTLPVKECLQPFRKSDI